MSEDQQPVVQQQIPYLRKIVYPTAQLATTKENGQDAILFIVPSGDAHTFPLDQNAKTALVRALTGGIEIPKVALPS